jgi:hypothetical protein
MLIVWDLYPNTEAPSSPTGIVAPRSSPNTDRPQPTAYPIPFSRPLVSVCSHPSSSKELVVGDSRGSVFITDWRSEPDESSWRRSSVVELVDPRAIADAMAGISGRSSGSVAWRSDNKDM